MLKIKALDRMRNGMRGSTQYVGIAADEQERIERHAMQEGKLLPLVAAGWTERDCMNWCRENKFLAPTYSFSNRSGCWFCPFQSVQQLRITRARYPDLWAIMLKWDLASPVPFKQAHKPGQHGRTLHDFERRFAWEDVYGVQKDFTWDLCEGFDPSTAAFQAEQLSLFGGEC